MAIIGGTAIISGAGSGKGGGTGAPGGPEFSIQVNHPLGSLYGDKGFTYDPSIQAIGGLTGLLVSSNLANSFPNSVVNPSITGTTTWGYTVVARRGNMMISETLETQITNGPATLDGSDTNTIIWTAQIGATSYDVYRTTANGTPATTGLISQAQTGTSFVDTGAAGDGTTPPYWGQTSGGYSAATLEGGFLGLLNGIHIGAALSSLTASAQIFIDPAAQLANIYYHNTTSADDVSVGAVQIVADLNPGDGDTAIFGLSVICVNSTTGLNGSADARSIEAFASSAPPAGKGVDIVIGINNIVRHGGPGLIRAFLGTWSQLFLTSLGSADLAAGYDHTTTIIQDSDTITNLIAYSVEPPEDGTVGGLITSSAGYNVTNHIGMNIPDMSVLGANSYGIHIADQVAATTATNWAIKVDGGVSEFDGLVKNLGGLAHNGNLGFFNTVPITKQTVTGAKLPSDTVMASLLAALVSYGLIVDSTT